MKTPERRIFFVGFLGTIPPGLRVFLPTVAAVLVCLFAGIGYVAGATQNDPGAGRFRFDLGPQKVTGIVRLAPYPTLTITEGTELLPAGHVLMLSGPGKRGPNLGGATDGQVARLRGIALTRGDLDMLQVGRAELVDEAMREVPGDTTLGRWRLTGEICDGKCLAGAMRPGRGIAHKACANLCLIGEVPPVFAASAPVALELAGSAFLLIAGPDGGPMADGLLDHVGALVEIEGEIMRRGDLLIFRADPATLRVL